MLFNFKEAVYTHTHTHAHARTHAQAIIQKQLWIFIPDMFSYHKFPS
jgi:hypothetical protein